MALSRDAVIWAYRLFLGREPESEGIVNERMQAANVLCLVREVVGLAEFSQSGRAQRIFLGRPLTKKTERQKWRRDRGAKANVSKLCDTITRDAVVWAYRFLLGREPESEMAIASKLSVRNNVQLLRSLVGSAEFARLGMRNDLLSVTRNAQASISEGHEFVLPQARMTSRFTIIGNCQAPVLATLLETMVPGLTAVGIELLPATVERLLGKPTELEKLVAESDVIAIGSSNVKFESILKSRYSGAVLKFRRFPVIEFSAFHPDVDYVEYRGKRIGGPMGHYHSVLALWGWKAGLSAEETVKLFRRDVFHQLRYFDYLAPSKAFLCKQGLQSDIPLDALVNKWLAKGCFMHSMNHPKVFVLADIAREILSREQTDFIPEVEDYVADPLSNNFCWPVYPEIAEALGTRGNYVFKRPGVTGSQSRHLNTITLGQFVVKSFSAYASYPKDEVFCARLQSERFSSLPKFLMSSTHGSVPNAQGYRRNAGPIASVINGTKVLESPYKGLPNYQYWRRAIERQARQDVDPVVAARFRLGRADKIATAGSCFAQHISRALKSHGFNYIVADEGKGKGDATEPANHGVFSARYGNIYTPRQLLQLFDRAYGNFRPAELGWIRADGYYADPFRPQIEPQGFVSMEELERSRADHLANVREIFRRLDILVFTLGLTEAWRSRIDGAVFPLAPGVVAGALDVDTHEFVNFETDEMISDLQQFIDRLRAVNAHARVILTVSPVPLIATFERRHVLVSTTYSKSALRAATDAVVRRNANCDYFPSYEIVTGSYARGIYFENDFRGVSAIGVENVMRLFMKHYFLEGGADEQSTLTIELMAEAARISEVICDEEAIDAAGAQNA